LLLLLVKQYLVGALQQLLFFFQDDFTSSCPSFRFDDHRVSFGRRSSSFGFFWCCGHGHDKESPRGANANVSFPFVFYSP
jgi:hypothetical protein